MTIKQTGGILLGMAGNNIPVNLDVLSFLKTRLLITANSGGGKSWMIRRIAELLSDYMPVIIIDPEGEFKTLREKFPFVLIGPGGEALADSKRLTALLALGKAFEFQSSRAVEAIAANSQTIADLQATIAGRIAELGKALKAGDPQPAKPVFTHARDIESGSVVKVANLLPHIPQQAKSAVQPADGEAFKLGGSILDILRCIADDGGEGVDDDEIAIMTSLKTTSRNVYKRKLAAAGYIQRGGKGLIVTQAGVAAMGGSWQPLPKGEALREYWLNRLTGGELALFRLYVAAFPESVSVDDLMQKTGLMTTSINVYRRKLKARRLIEDNTAKAALFE